MTEPLLCYQCCVRQCTSNRVGPSQKSALFYLISYLYLILYGGSLMWCYGHYFSLLVCSPVVELFCVMLCSIFLLFTHCGSILTFAYSEKQVWIFSISLFREHLTVAVGSLHIFAATFLIWKLSPLSTIHAMSY